MMGVAVGSTGRPDADEILAKSAGLLLGACGLTEAMRACHQAVVDTLAIEDAASPWVEAGIPEGLRK